MNEDAFKRSWMDIKKRGGGGQTTEPGSCAWVAARSEAGSRVLSSAASGVSPVAKRRKQPRGMAFRLLTKPPRNWGLCCIWGVI